LTNEGLSKPKFLRMIEEGGISCGEVKFEEIRRNTKSEGNLLGHT
jgi:hypothetical protein